MYNIFFAFFIFHILYVEIDSENLAVRKISIQKMSAGQPSVLLNVFAADTKGGLDVKQRRNFKISYLKCTVCGSIMPIPRRFGRFREKNHIKTMYCYKCDTERDFLENTEDERYSDELPDIYEPETNIKTDINPDTDADTIINTDSNTAVDMNTDEKMVTDIRSEEDSEFYYRFPEPLEKYL